MQISSEYIRSVGRHEGRGRYYSCARNHYYAGTDYSESAASFFTLDVRPAVGDYLQDLATGRGFFVVDAQVGFEKGEPCYFEVSLLPSNEQVSLVRHSAGDGAAGQPVVARSVLFEGLPAALEVELKQRQGGVMRYVFTLQQRYQPCLGDMLICSRNRCYTVVELLPDIHPGLVRVRALM